MTDEEYNEWMKAQLQEDARPAYMKLMSSLGLVFTKGSTALLRGTVFYEENADNSATYDVVDGNAVPNRNIHLVNGENARNFVYPAEQWESPSLGAAAAAWQQSLYKDATASLGATVLFWMVVAGATTALVMKYAKPKRAYVRRRRVSRVRRRVGIYRRRRRTSAPVRARVVRRAPARRGSVRRYYKRRK